MPQDATVERLAANAPIRNEAKPIAHIRLHERCANLCFDGADNNRLFMASSHSLYALYVNTRGAEVRPAGYRGLMVFRDVCQTLRFQPSRPAPDR